MKSTWNISKLPSICTSLQMKFQTKTWCVARAREAPCPPKGGAGGSVICHTLLFTIKWAQRPHLLSYYLFTYFWHSALLDMPLKIRNQVWQNKWNVHKNVYSATCPLFLLYTHKASIGHSGKQDWIWVAWLQNLLIYMICCQ